MSIYLQNAKNLLDTVTLENPEILQAKEQLTSISKISGMTDLINDPKFQNIVNLLTPFVVNYKVNQVLKLLKEIEKEQRHVDPDTGLRRYI